MYIKVSDEQVRQAIVAYRTGATVASLAKPLAVTPAALGRRIKMMCGGKLPVRDAVVAEVLAAKAVSQ